MYCLWFTSLTWLIQQRVDHQMLLKFHWVVGRSSCTNLRSFMPSKTESWCWLSCMPHGSSRANAILRSEIFCMLSLENKLVLSLNELFSLARPCFIRSRHKLRIYHNVQCIETEVHQVLSFMGERPTAEFAFFPGNITVDLCFCRGEGELRYIQHVYTSNGEPR